MKWHKNAKKCLRENDSMFSGFFGTFPTPEMWGVPMYVGGCFRVCQGGPCARPPRGPWGRVVTLSGGRVHIGGLILHRLACFPPLNTQLCPCMFGVTGYVGRLPCTRPLADLVARRYVARFCFRSECFLIAFRFRSAGRNAEAVGRKSNPRTSLRKEI